MVTNLKLRFIGSIIFVCRSFNITKLKVDGGASANRLLMQFQSDISNGEIVKGTSEATALGAAFLAGLAVGFWKDEEELKGLVPSSKNYTCNMDEKERNLLIKGWKKAVRHASNWMEI